MSYQKKEQYNLSEHLGFPANSWWIRVARHFSFSMLWFLLQVPFVQCFVPNVSDVSGLSILDCLFDFLKRLFMKFFVRGYHENCLFELSVDIAIFNSKCYIHMCVYICVCTWYRVCVCFYILYIIFVTVLIM